MNRALVLSGAVTFAFFAWYLGPAIDLETSPAGSNPAYASGSMEGGNGAEAQAERHPGTFQGRTARWWARRAVQARKDANARGQTIRRLRHAQLRSSAHFFGWLQGADCVHRHESIRWEAATGNGYYGGMQADLGFQRAYAPDHLARWGTANNWPWWAQLEMAYRGWLFRGWQPWPNTSRACGLR
jgi:hypothetical protein